MGRRAAIQAKKRNRRVLTVAFAVGIVAMVVAVTLIAEAGLKVPGDRYSSSNDQPVSPSMLQELYGVGDSTLSAIGIPSSVTPPTPTKSASQLLTLDGKPEVLYIGGDFCPYCALERWSLIVALSHFGNFSGLEYMQSSRTDVNPNTPTFTFSNASYVSKYVSFVSVEETNREGQTVASLNGNESSLFSQYGTCAASGESGDIPFVDIANAYVANCGAQFSLPQIAGESWTQIASQLGTPNSMVAQEIDGAANTLIAAICKVDGGQPSSVCGQSYAMAPQGAKVAAALGLAVVGCPCSSKSVVREPLIRNFVPAA
jgi:thiol-disulfide isomerase/thioredoxin